MDIYPISYKSKYERWYYSIIIKVKSQHRSRIDGTYYESHHIVPLSLGGLDNEKNLVLLTYREHLLCHWLLYKFNEGDKKAKMSFAFWAMCNYKNQHRNRIKTPFRILESAKIAHIKEMSNKNAGSGNPMYGSKGGFYGKNHTEEHK